MERWAKNFTKASLLYLLVGSLLGIFLGSDPYWSGKIKFVHIHFNLLGFMTMMIAGVAYHVLPRFNSRPVPWPGGVKVQFYLQNIGLLGMAEEYMAGGMWSGGPLQVLFVLFALMTWSGLCIMVYNLYGVLRPLRVTIEDEPINQDWKVADVLDRYPHLLDVLVKAGFTSLENPVARQTFAKVVTLEKACAKHQVNLEPLLEALNKAKDESGQGKGATGHPMGATIRRGERCRKDIMVGSLIRIYPETKAVFERFYGEGCFDCPGQAFETVEQTAHMHNVAPEEVLNALNATIEEALKKTQGTGS